MITAYGRARRLSPPATAQVPSSIADIDGNPLELEDQPIGSGGQGSVYRVRQSRFAVKLIHRQEETEGLGDTLAERLDRLHWLPMEGLPIARPIRSLASPHLGYTMDLLEDMAPMEPLCEAPEGDIVEWYLSGGGLERRLRLLARLADVLAVLHGRGMVYSDLSPRNVLVSVSREHHQVWLIDPDNIAVESSALGRTIGTPRYLAPELYNGRSGNSQFSDVFSLAVLVHQALRADHPLIGDLADLSVENEQRALCGELPWTGHSSDDRNRSACGLPEDLVLTARIRRLLQDTFEAGLNDPMKRPTARAWANALGAAADLTLACRRSGCRGSYYMLRRRCPYCDSPRPDFALAVVRTHLPANRGPQGREPGRVDSNEGIVLMKDRPVIATQRHSRLIAEAAESPAVRLRWDGDDTVHIENLGSEPVRRVPPSGGGGRRLMPRSNTSERISSEWRLHFGDDDRFHRMLSFYRFKAERA
ncbi:protein kinase domain-containing protein [Glycomyces harbinensis]|uniref:Protein kinase domain-containing protein n=1 Tax=Glycomyces harbinensis TaxID=58114 RepID=A0A1G7AZV5_9ACTN|nr:hypothetical protein [Glycomyces harbinensis]SDE20333.1 Protein kinase domain-containing protein [Glycomyces harbinensis]